MSDDMKKQSITAQIIKLFLIVIGIVLGVVALILVIGWWQGWTTEDKFQTAIQIAGMLILGVGLLGIKGSWDGTRNFQYQYSMSASKQSSWERVQQNLIDFSQSYAFMLVCLAAGLICLAIGWLM